MENEPAGISEDAPKPARTLPDVNKNSFLVVMQNLAFNKVYYYLNN
jgi:hypothetical protein